MKPYPVQLEISGPTAMWTRPDTGSSPVSYPAPTFSAVKGIFESILRWKSVNVRPTRVEICRPVQFHRYTTNYGGPLRATDAGQRGRMTSSVPSESPDSYFRFENSKSVILMTYQRFEDVPVWQKAADLYEAAEELLENQSFRASRGFRDQLDRAALSVSNNIAEGFERGTTNELLAFIYIARGSADLKSIAESCSRQLRGWADSLQNSEIKGQRHLTEKSRHHDDQKKRAAAIQKELLEKLPSNHPLRTDARKRGVI